MQNRANTHAIVIFIAFSLSKETKVLSANKPESGEVKAVAEKPPTRVEKRALAKATRNVKNGIMKEMRKLVRVQQEAVLPTIKLTIIR